MAEKKERAVEGDQALRNWEERKKSGQGINRSMVATPRPAWCPARTLHNVPTSRLSRIQSSRKLSLSMAGGGRCKDEDVYRQDSFLSVEDTVSSCSDSGNREAGWSGGSSSQSESAAEADQTGTLKTVQVCCKTLKYFCICDK